MKVVGSFNKISEKLQKEIPVLKPGETMTFQMLNGIPNPDPNHEEKIRNPMLFGKTQLLTNFRIFDPYLDEHGGYVDVGAVEIWDKENPVRFWTFIAGFGEHQFTGKFSLSGGNIKDQEIFDIFWLSDQREGNKHADPSVPKMFKLLNAGAETKATLSKVDNLRKALNLTANMQESDARTVWASLNRPNIKEKDALMGAISEYAKDNVDAFLAAYDDKDKDTKAMIREAFDKGLLEHDLGTSNVKMGKEILTNVGITADILGVVNEWFKTAQNGEQVKTLLKNQLTKKGKKELAEA